MILVNGQFPGPTIVATEGDILRVHVTNNLDTPTSLHWHGMLQHGTNEMDGAAGTTQCAIPPGRTFTYRFALKQSGTYWYHSHSGVQYADGAKGALIIYDKHTPPYHYDAEYVIQLSDHYHTLADILLDYYLSNARYIFNLPSLNKSILNQ